MGPPEGPGAVREAFTRSALVLCGEQVGSAAACLDMVLEHVKTRTVFSRTLSSFQAIKHMCADMYLQLRAARAAVYRAGWLLSVDDPGSDLSVAAAKAVTSRNALTVARATIQAHGAIGVTWEHRAHLYLKRAMSSYELFGSPEHYDKQVALGIGLLKGATCE
jgi:alkylation response protein AidB-like acyl-CoA dehydrogenase